MGGAERLRKSARILPPTGEVTGIRYSGCRDNADVILYTVHGGGHAWPGGEPLPVWLVGRTTQDIDATAVMWEFFQLHPLNSEYALYLAHSGICNFPIINTSQKEGAFLRHSY